MDGAAAGQFEGGFIAIIENAPGVGLYVVIGQGVTGERLTFAVPPGGNTQLSMGERCLYLATGIGPVAMVVVGKGAEAVIKSLTRYTPDGPVPITLEELAQASRWGNDAPNSAVVDFAKAGAGANWKNIDQLKSYLRRHPVGGEYPQLITGKLADTFLTAKGKGAAFVIQPNGTFGIFIRTGATKREVLHEIGHLLTFEHVGSKAAYEQLGGAMREHLASLFVLTRQGSISRLTLSESALENAALLSNPTYSQTILDLLRKWGIKP
jgi:hypothetical protein